MELGFVNFNTEEKQKAYKVLQIIRESQAIDELGIGRIRDAFSNVLFPGMSTLQHHAKYFAVLPSLYYTVCKGKYNNIREVRNKIIELEIRLTRQFVEASKNDETSDPFGITGSGVLDAAEKDISKYVKYDPTYIYYNGMVTYGMIKSNANIYSLILEQSRKYHDTPTRMKLKKGEDGPEDASELRGDRQIIATCEEHYDFFRNNELSLALTYKEAEYIKKHIEQSEESKKSLLSYLLRHDIPVNANNSDDMPLQYDDLGVIWKDRYELPEEYRIPYILSVRFSNFINLLRIRYKYIYDKNTEQYESAEEMAQLFLDTWNKEKEELTVEKIAEIMFYCNPLVQETTVKNFCIDAARLLNDEKWEELDNKIKCREIQVKSRERSKLCNPARYINAEFKLQRRITYRWELVNIMINEIRKGIKYGKR